MTKLCTLKMLGFLWRIQTPLPPLTRPGHESLVTRHSCGGGGELGGAMVITGAGKQDGLLWVFDAEVMDAVANNAGCH